jgi:hypothetical protein
VKEEYRHLTAFICELGVFQFNRVPFGLRNAPAYFQHILSKVVLAGLQFVICENWRDFARVGGEMS